MRLAYFDEAGISNPNHEPIMTVAGVVVDGDRQYKAVESYLDRLADKYVPDRSRSFRFHAYELHSGVKNFPKERWPLDLRLEIMERIVDIPSLFDLAVFHCSIDRAEMKNLIPGDDKNLQACVEHAHAFFFCALQVEMFLRKTEKDENGLLIAEDRKEVRRMIKSVHSMFRDRPESPLKIPEEAMEPYMRYLPFERIIEDVQFAEKSSSSLLQVSDICAFVIKRKISLKPHSDRYFNLLRENFILGGEPVGFGSSIADAFNKSISEE